MLDRAMINGLYSDVMSMRHKDQAMNIFVEFIEDCLVTLERIVLGVDIGERKKVRFYLQTCNASGRNKLHAICCLGVHANVEHKDYALIHLSFCDILKLCKKHGLV